VKILVNFSLVEALRSDARSFFFSEERGVQETENGKRKTENGKRKTENF